MLIGPSGAGKSTYLKRMQIPADHIISSDRFRLELCGDFKDQSKNTQVFDAVHALARTRLEHGLDVWIDATNIKARDRRKLRDLAPNDAVITYTVIDRPLDQKMRDGDWRNAVIFDNGKTLVEKHHETFQQNLKAILNGDGDKRVSVWDLRDQ